MFGCAALCSFKRDFVHYRTRHRRTFILPICVVYISMNTIKHFPGLWIICKYNSCHQIRYSDLLKRSLITSTIKSTSKNNIVEASITSKLQKRFEVTGRRDIQIRKNYFSCGKLSSNSPKLNVTVFGSGNWGTTVARIIGNNVKLNKKFNEVVQMYVYEENVGNKKLSEIINTEHENVKYLPGYKIPANVVAVSDARDAVDGSDIIIFVLPHEFIYNTCKILDGKIKKSALAISLVKGIYVKSNKIVLVTEIIKSMLNVNVAVLMGANIASEVAAEQFSEATLGIDDKIIGSEIMDLFQTSYFHLTLSNDIPTIELCGALKNIVALGAGFVDGLGYGNNTKAAVIRLGLKEMVRFVQWFHPSSKLSTFLESCGIADLLTTCYGGRNRKAAEALVHTKKALKDLEIELFNGQKLQGPCTAQLVFQVVSEHNLDAQFPLFLTIHNICIGKMVPDDIITAIKKSSML